MWTLPTFKVLFEVVVNPLNASDLLNPLETSESVGFLMFSGVKEKYQWHAVG